MIPHNKRIENALRIAMDNGSVDGGHHKDWIIDQMVRAMTGCPVVSKVHNGHTYEVQGESELYIDFIRVFEMSNEDGLDINEWSVGIPP